jgi:pimeloyl-ACP methyl ester carboxylesterase
MTAVTCASEPVRVELDHAVLRELDARLAATRIATNTTEGWETGTPERWLAELVEDWRAFDPRRLQARLDQLTHNRIEAHGIGVHFVHARGAGVDPLPLLLTHGWPSSFLEYLEVLPLLTDPAAHGGAAEDAFTVVAPSLPGFGFSGAPPPGGLTAHQIAELWHEIMGALGYRRFVAHGSDLGAGVTARLARAHPDVVAAIHLATPGLPPPPRPWSDAVARHFEEDAAWDREEGGYAHMHATKPSTIGAALTDSPAGLAAWIGEKLTAWSGTTADGEPAFNRELLLCTLTLYWTTNTAACSLLPYWAYQHRRASALPADDPAPTPTAIDIFGGEVVPFPKPPRELAERYFKVVRWAEHDRGGHFPATAEPGLLAESLREAFRPYR